jgi:uncharacterized protein YdeI (YjbR/CyaY-like superfamily)
MKVLVDALRVVSFPDAKSFEAWLAAEPPASPGAWIRFAKKGAPEASLAKAEAIDSALAHGWIDGQLARIDDQYFKIRFTPRRRGSMWSQVNRERVAALISEGRMTPAGEVEVARAKADGRWDRAYPPQGVARPDDDLAAALQASPAAQRLYDDLDSANRYAILHRVHQAKTPERRAAKIALLVEMLARGETVHPRRQKRGG